MQKMPPSSWGKLGESKGGGSTPPPPPKSDPSPPPSGGGGDSPPADEDPDTIVTPWGTSFKAKKKNDRKEKGSTGLPFESINVGLWTLENQAAIGATKTKGI